ncbi:MAG: alpha/beta fold hydrolase [Acidimicrobiia bacterium]
MKGPVLLRLADGRTLAYDDVGDPAGVPVVYLHGAPDCRLARHPDDGVAAAAGVRLLAVDRPGYGRSTFDPSASLASVAADVGALADAVGMGRFGMSAWSAGAPYALAVAATRPRQVRAVAVGCGLAPIAGRPELHEWVAEAGAAALAEDAAMVSVPAPAGLDVALARQHLAESGGPLRATELAAVPGAELALARSLVEALAGGVAGFRRDVEVLLSDPDVDFTAVGCPVRLLYGERDPVAPPAHGRWWAGTLASTELEVVAGAGHTLCLVRWAQLLRWLAQESR